MNRVLQIQHHGTQTICPQSAMQSSSSNLDLLRSLAVIFVVISHLIAIHQPIPTIRINETSGYLTVALGYWGVFIFFVHTCYVLMGSLSRQAQQEGKKHLAYRFWVQRIFRIYPLSMTTVLAVTAISYFSGSDLNAVVILSNLFLIQNLTDVNSTPGPLWSLPFEIQMYLLLPALFLLIYKKRRTYLIIVLWLLSVGATVFFAGRGWSHGFIKFIPCFLPGVLAFTLYEVKRILPAIFLWGYALIGAMCYPLLVAYDSQMYWLAWPLCLVLGLLIALTKEIQNKLIKLVSEKVARYSFGIYLVHVPCIEWAFAKVHGISYSMQWLLFACATTAVTYLAYHLIEKPGIDFGRRWVARHL